MHLNASRSQKAKITVTLSNDLVHQIDQMLDSPEAGSRNQCENDVIVVPLSTTLRVAPRHVELPAGEGGLKEPSMAKCEQVTTLDKSFLIRGPFAGTISPSIMREIETAYNERSGSQHERRNPGKESSKNSDICW